MSKTRTWARRLRWLVGLGLLGALIGVAGPRQMLSLFLRIEPMRAVVAVALSVLWLVMGGFNVWILLRRVAAVPFSTFLPVYGTSWAASQLLPSQLGDATQVLLLREHEVPASRGGAVYLTDKVISIGWLFLVAAYGVGLYIPEFRGAWLALPPVAVLIVGGVSVWIVLRLRLRPGGLASRLQGLVSRTLQEVGGMRRYRGTLVLNGVLTIVRWLVNASFYFVTFRAFGFAIPFKAAATIPVMSSLVGYIPVTVGGAGTTEWTATLLFAQVGAATAVVVSAYLFLRVAHLSIALSLIALPRLGWGGAEEEAGRQG